MDIIRVSCPIIWAVFDDTKLTSDGTKLCNNTIKIRKDSSTGEELTEPGAGGTFIKIAYKKTAFYDDCTNVNAIYIDGVPAYTIRLVKDTGRHFYGAVTF